MTVLIKPMEPWDIPSCVEIVKENYDEEASVHAMSEMNSAIVRMRPQPVYFVAFVGAEVVGFLGISESFMNSRIMEIFWVNVRARLQRCGIGSMLVQRAIEHAQKQNAESVMLTATDTLKKFYSRLGFVPRGPIGNDNYDDNLMEWKPAPEENHGAREIPRVQTGNVFRDAMANNRGIHTNS